MTPKEQQKEILAKTIIANLEKRQMEGFYCKTKNDAVNKVLELIPEKASIGYGGSATLNESGILESLRANRQNLIQRENFGKDKEKELKNLLINSDFFLMSTNAMTTEGELVNIDGRGNRTCYLIYGPENVIIVAGWNKITPDLESAEKRARASASPNCIRLNLNTPCSKTGKCEDCFSPECICNQFVITRRSGIKGRIKVILVGEELGF